MMSRFWNTASRLTLRCALAVLLASGAARAAGLATRHGVRAGKMKKARGVEYYVTFDKKPGAPRLTWEGKTVTLEILDASQKKALDTLYFENESSLVHSAAIVEEFGRLVVTLQLRESAKPQVRVIETRRTATIALFWPSHQLPRPAAASTATPSASAGKRRAKGKSPSTVKLDSENAKWVLEPSAKTRAYETRVSAPEDGMTPPDAPSPEPSSESPDARDTKARAPAAQPPAVRSPPAQPSPADECIRDKCNAQTGDAFYQCARQCATHK